MLFSEPKIPQSCFRRSLALAAPRFSALQRAENSSNNDPAGGVDVPAAFQCSSASRKFLKRSGSKCAERCARVSVLFSEPKIPQTTPATDANDQNSSFSALQRAENSSNLRRAPPPAARRSFSALQRAENSSKERMGDPHRGRAAVSVLFSEPKIPQILVSADARNPKRSFQCSSASRKFLKNTLARELHSYAQVSVLFSEPKIPQRCSAVCWCWCWCVSVLFSEPKIPQCRIALSANGELTGFSALQRAENSSMRVRLRRHRGTLRFSALQRAENSSIYV